MVVLSCLFSVLTDTTNASTGIGDIVLNRSSAKELYFNIGCQNIDTLVSDDIYYASGILVASYR